MTIVTLANVDIAAANVAGDLPPDLIIVNALDNTITILANAGGGVFTQSATIPVGIEPIDVSSTDIDNDRDLDVVACNQQSGTLSLPVNQGGGTFAQP